MPDVKPEVVSLAEAGIPPHNIDQTLHHVQRMMDRHPKEPPA